MDMIIKEFTNMIILMFELMLLPLISTILMLIIIGISKRISKKNKMRDILAKVYKIVSVIHNILLTGIILMIFLRISRIISISLCVLIFNIILINGTVLENSQIQFMLLTMIIVFYYPISVLFIKYCTLKKYKEKKQKLMFVAVFGDTLKFLKRIPIEETINIGYVIFLICDSIIKVGTTVNSFDNNYVYLSFIIYLAIQTSASIIYKKHKEFFDKIDNHLFKTDMLKKKSKELDANKDLKLANEYILEFISTGKTSKKIEKLINKSIIILK